MQKITQDQLPRHICERIDETPTSYLLQEWKGKWRKVLVIGESPALNGWILSWRAFYTQEGKLVASGKRFNELFESFWVRIEDVSFTELCKCILGTERKLLASCAPKCWKHLAKQIEEVKPSLIIILGKHTLDILNSTTSKTIPMWTLSAQEFAWKKYQFLTLYHPSPVNPKSRVWNQEIIHKNRAWLQDLCDSL